MHYHHVWWVVLYLKHVTRILFSPRKHFKIGSWSKPHIHLKRELSHDTRLPEIIPTTQHMLCDIVSCQHCWVQIQTLAKMASSPGPSCGQTWSKVVLKFCWSFPHGLVWWSFNESGNHITGHHLGYWSTAPKRILHISLHKHTFSPQWKSCSAQTWFPKLLLKWCHHLVHHPICDVSMHLNTCYQTLFNGLTAHNCHSHLYTTHY